MSSKPSAATSSRPGSIVKLLKLSDQADQAEDLKEAEELSRKIDELAKKSSRIFRVGWRPSGHQSEFPRRSGDRNRHDRGLEQAVYDYLGAACH